MDARNCEQFDTNHPCCNCKNKCGYQLEDDRDKLMSMLEIERKQKEFFMNILTDLDNMIRLSLETEGSSNEQSV